MTIKATGYQWYWGYEYPDHGGFAFDSLMLNDDERGDQPAYWQPIPPWWCR